MNYASSYDVILTISPAGARTQVNPFTDMDCEKMSPEFLLLETTGAFDSHTVWLVQVQSTYQNLSLV